MNKTVVMTMLSVDEGIKLKPYKCTAGKLTIGIGRNIEDKGITEKEALFLLSNDIDECYKDLNESIFHEFYTFPENIQHVLINMRFQLGFTGFRNFKKMITAFVNRDYQEARNQMKDSKWYEQTQARADRLIKMVHG